MVRVLAYPVLKKRKHKTLPLGIKNGILYTQKQPGDSVLSHDLLVIFTAVAADSLRDAKILMHCACSIQPTAEHQTTDAGLCSE